VTHFETTKSAVLFDQRPMQRTRDIHSLTKRVLSVSTSDDAEQYAWVLLLKVSRLFPRQFAELTALESTAYDDAILGDDDSDQLEGPLAYDEKRLAAVLEWTRRHRVSCPAVDAVASEIAVGTRHPRPANSSHFVKAGKLVVDTPSIHAQPFAESLEDFLGRAREHYLASFLTFEKHGYRVRKPKRTMDHFGHLAAHLVGSYTWIDIATGKTGLALPTGDPKTIAGEAIKAARLIGLPAGKPGRPRKSSPR